MWVVDMEKKLEDAEPAAKVAKWRKHCVFRVPPRFKRVHGTGYEANGRDASVYKPQTVALGPFHHDDTDLKPMEEHKLRAVRHLLLRARKTLGDLVAKLNEVAEELEDAYVDLGDEWRGENRGKFLEMMITDGCFLVEVMKTAAAKHSIPPDYDRDDPVFSWHGIQHIKPFIQRDMLMLENQLPLMLLERIVAVTSQDASSINSMVLKFLEARDIQEGTNLGLHPLDIYRKSLLEVEGPEKRVQRGVEMTAPAVRIGHHRRRHPRSYFKALVMTKYLGHDEREKAAVPRSALKLWEAGIRFVPSLTTCLDDIKFHPGRLEMPKVHLDDSTAYRFHNMMAFEAMHVGTRNDVTAYVLFVKDLVDSVEDVRLLARKKILPHDIADDDAAVVRLFNGLTRDVCKTGESRLCGERDGLEKFYRENGTRVFLYESWAKLRNKYFRSPWTLLALVTAILLLAGDIMQAVYAVKSYEADKAKPKVK